MVEFNYSNFIDFLSRRFVIDKEKILFDSVFTEDLGIDSLTLYSLISDVENKYNIHMDLDDITQISTVGKVYTYIENEFKKKGSFIIEEFNE